MNSRAVEKYLSVIQKYGVVPHSVLMMKETSPFVRTVRGVRYTNAQGDKVLPFGMCHNVFGSFPEYGYIG